MHIFMKEPHFGDLVAMIMKCIPVICLNNSLICTLCCDWVTMTSSDRVVIGCWSHDFMLHSDWFWSHIPILPSDWLLAKGTAM